MLKKLLKKRQEYIQSKVQVDLFWKKKEEINATHYRMLEEFDRFCQEHEIEYWLEGGSLIGAHFHQAIIPWDDDLDLAMTRESWNKLIALNPQWDDMVLQTYGNDKHFNSVKFYKLRDKHTYLNDGRYWSSASNEHQGLFVDIFVYDDCQNKSFSDSGLRHQLHYYFQVSLRAFYEVFHVLPFENLRKRFLSSYEVSNEAYDYMRYDMRSLNKATKDYYFEKRQVFPLQRVKFGPSYYPAPKNIPYYLQIQYGDIVKYPPKEHQKPSHLIEYRKLSK